MAKKKAMCIIQGCVGTQVFGKAICAYHECITPRGPMKIIEKVDPVYPADELIDAWAEELSRIYDERTAGDHTFSGVLTKFLRDYERLKKPEIIVHNHAPKIETKKSYFR